MREGFKNTCHKKGRLFRTVKLLNQLHYFCVKSQLELQGQMYNLGGFPEQSLYLLLLTSFIFFFSFSLKANCTELQASAFSRTKSSSYSFIFPLQKTPDESEETNTHILGRNRLLSELGAWKHTETHKGSSEGGCRGKEPYPEL